MGYLGSSFMKSFAIKMKIKADNSLMSITMQANHAKKQLDLKQKHLTAQQKNMESIYSRQASGQIAQLNASMNALKGADGTITDQNQYSQLQASIFQIQQDAQWQKQQASAMFDLQMEQELEPLRSTSELLEIEKHQAEQDASFWKQVQESYTPKVKEDVKSVIPDPG